MCVKTIIEIKNLCTKYGDIIIHDNLNLNIETTEVIALIGDSGAGKSTLFREMLLLEKPASGSIKIFQQEILTLSEKQSLLLRRHCGVMFQHGALFNGLTVVENIAVPLHEHTKLSKKLIQEIAEFKIALVGLPANCRNKYPAELSGGMIKRVAVARALALDPEILFLDEPTSGLDPVAASALDELIIQLKASLGLTVVMITHDLDSLWKITDRVAVLAEKHVFAVNAIDKLIHIDHPWLQAYFHGSRGCKR